ncbi:MAG: CARDB domain-containing protein, partial [Thermoanaerobaculia bacterium]
GNASEPSLPISLEWDSAGAADLAITAADLTVLPGAPVVEGAATAAVTVRNLGPTASSSTDLLAFAQGPGGYLVTLFEAAPLPPLPPGGSATLSASFVLGAEPGAYELVAFADPFGRVEEGDEQNNIADRAFPVVPAGGLHLAASTDRPVYLPDDEVITTVEIAYGGETLPGRLEIRIEDASGYLVDLLLAEEVTLEYGDVRGWQVAWGTAAAFAGPYRAAASLLDPQDRELVSAAASFVVAEGFELAAAVTTDRPAYLVGEPVRSSAEVRYLDGNTLLTDLEGRLDLFDPSGLPVGQWSASIGPLLPGAEASFSFDWSSAGREPGSYRALWTVLRGALPQATAETTFALEAPPARFSGDLTLDSHEPPFPVPVGAALRVTNESAEPVAEATVRLRLVDPAGGGALAQREWLVDFAPGVVFEAETSFETEPLESVEYLILLTVEPAAGEGAGQEETLAVESFLPVDRTAPTLTVLQPLAGGFLGADDPAAVMHAQDERSGIARVEARIDDGGWVVMAPADPEAATYRLDLSALPEGSHQLEGRATDGAGNVTTTTTVDFVADWTAPLIQVSGVEDGGTYEEAVVPVVAVVESHPAWEEIRLDGEPFVSGTSVEEAGDHLLEVEAADAAGNAAELILDFTIVPQGQSLDLVVNTVNDVDDGVCDLAHCSLREAIAAANRHPSFDAIRFA